MSAEGSSGRAAIGLTPFHRDGELSGILIAGRWPDTTLEWSQLLVASLRVACVPGILSTTRVFAALEERPEESEPDVVGLIMSVGTVLGAESIERRHLDSQPPALLLLHPPNETTPSLPECSDVASGCVLLPGLPELGLDHRAGWAETEADGTLISLRNKAGINPADDPDTAVLSLLLAS